jgi:diacylglycerol kinase family enzyme
MKVLFVINPVSGGVDKEPFIKDLKSKCEKYGIEYYIFKTSGKDDKKNLKKALSEFKPDKVASVGGDGTLLFTAILLMEENIPLGIIPFGSADGMASELFVSQEPSEALNDFLLSEVIEEIDMLMINDKHYMIHMGDVGVNANIIEDYSKDNKRGMAVYAKYFIKKLRETKAFKIKFKCNGKTYDESGIMISIGNGRKFGTGIPINLKGNPMDGKFEIIVIHEFNLNSLLKAGLSKFDESFYENQNLTIVSTDKAEIRFDEPRLLQLDGEIIDKYEKIDVKIIKGAVKLITHNNNEYLS